MTPWRAGDRVEVRSLSRPLYEGTVAADADADAGEVLVVKDGGTKPRPFAPSRLRRLQRRAAPAPRALERAPNREAKLRAVPRRPAPARCAEYLAYVRTHGCYSCTAPGPVEAHHWARRGQGGGGTGAKPDDYRTVPLCRDCHQHYHDTGALPGMNPAATKALILAWQVDLLVAWIVARAA